MPPVTLTLEGYLSISITKQPGVIYKVQSASSIELSDWSAATTTVLVDTLSTLTVRDNVPITDRGERFLRVRTTTP